MKDRDGVSGRRGGMKGKNCGNSAQGSQRGKTVIVIFWCDLNQFWSDTTDVDLVTKLHLKHNQWTKYEHDWGDSCSYERFTQALTCSLSVWGHQTMWNQKRILALLKLFPSSSSVAWGALPICLGGPPPNLPQLVKIFLALRRIMLDVHKN